MVVMAIAILILGLAAGTYMNMGDGIRVDGSTQQVGAAILRARQQAQASRVKVAVLLPGPSIQNDSNIPNERKFTAYRTAFVTDEDDDGIFEFDSFLPESKWNFVVPGTAIMEADTDIGIRDGTGTIKDPSDDTFSQVNGVDLSVLGGNSSTNGIRAIVFTPSGRLKADATSYVTIGQAHFNAGIWQILNVASETGVNESSSNQITIEINRFTGGLRYLKPSDY